MRVVVPFERGSSSTPKLAKIGQLAFTRPIQAVVASGEAGVVLNELARVENIYIRR